MKSADPRRAGGVMMRTALAFFAVVLGACSAPTSFDGLTGGTVVDSALVAPRPTSPVSVSMVATLRPKLKWSLTGSLTGAVVEMSRSREFPPDATKTFAASGSELVVPEDLEPGMWFWRLTGSTAKAQGTTKSVTWEFLVRGPARFGSSDTPSGALVDIDGDGRVDLITVGEAPDEDMTFTLPFELLGREGGLLEKSDKASVSITSTPAGKALTPIALGGGTDIDGDGISDFVYATAIDWNDGSPVEPWVEWWPGSPKGLDADRMNPVFVAFGPGFLEPTVAAAGDVDGDGFGDMVIGGGQVSYVGRGGATGLTGSTPVAIIRDYPSDIRAGAVLGAFDADGDGVSDLAIAQPRVNMSVWRNGAATRPDAVEQKIRYGGSPFASSEVGETDPDFPLPDFRRAVRLSSGLSRQLESSRYLTVSRPPADGATAKAMTSGDFNGDGLADVASVMVEATTTRVCVYLGSREHFLVESGCVDGIEGDALGIAGISAGDLEGDGQDELLIAAAGKVHAVHFDQNGGRQVEVIAQVPKVQAIETVWPGRPNQARWAVSDGSTIIVFEGTTEKQRIAKPTFVTRGWGRVMR
ncbi:MAG: VCBS repeat-containing protein [Deltaproteobacteria bacterium]|nr:VCBS repeat-containing protein [Deltaproteobacteria bacterium]